MKKIYLSAIAALFVTSTVVFAKEARLVRYPHYDQGRVAFSYLGDVWTADETGQNIQRLTVHKSRDVFPRFSPDGKWIAFSSDRNGNLDVYLMPSSGGTVKQLTTHSADDAVLTGTPPPIPLQKQERENKRKHRRGDGNVMDELRGHNPSP